MDWLVTMDWTHMLLAAPLIGLALATAGTETKPPDTSTDGGGKGDDAKGKGDDGKQPPSQDGDAPPERSPGESLELERLRRELKQREGNEARIRDRLRKERQKTAGLQGSSEGQDAQGVTLTAKTLSEIVSTTVAQTLSTMGLAKAKGEEPIPGLEMHEDGSATYYGQEIEPAQVRLVTNLIRTGLKQSADETTPAIKAMQDRLDQMDRKSKEDAAAVARERDKAETEALEEEYLGHVRAYGVALAEQHFSHLPESQQKRAAKWFDRELDLMVSDLTDPDGKYRVDLLDLNDEVVARLSRDILQSLDKDFASEMTGAQAAANDKAREKEPLPKGGTTPEKTTTEDDFDNMTSEQREAYLDREAARMREESGVSLKRGDPDSPTY